MTRTHRDLFPPVVSVTALAGVPALIRHAYGEKTLAHANRAALLDIEAIEDLDCFVPYATVSAFLGEVERRTGECDLGLLFGQHLSITNYGTWADYVLSAATLGDALSRAISTIGYHSRGDRMAVSVEKGVARVRYRSAARGLEGYVHIATGTARILLSILETYLPPVWRPMKIELDVPRPASRMDYDGAFGCPVEFDASSISITLHAEMLSTVGRKPIGKPLLTVEDLARARVGAASLHSLHGVVAAHVRAQVLSGSVSESNTALALGISVRSLQRALDREGWTFRQLTTSIRMGRAEELLHGTSASITEISAMLGYSSPANFARAFHQFMGITPREFRGSRARFD